MTQRPSDHNERFANVIARLRRTKRGVEDFELEVASTESRCATVVETPQWQRKQKLDEMARCCWDVILYAVSMLVATFGLRDAMPHLLALAQRNNDLWLAAALLVLMVLYAATGALSPVMVVGVIRRIRDTWQD